MRLLNLRALPAFSPPTRPRALDAPLPWQRSRIPCKFCFAFTLAGCLALNVSGGWEEREHSFFSRGRCCICPWKWGFRSFYLAPRCEHWGCDTRGEDEHAAQERATGQRVRRALWAALSSLCRSRGAHKRHTAERRTERHSRTRLSAKGRLWDRE